MQDFEEYGDERAAEAREAARAERNLEFADNLLRRNKLSFEEIADAADVPLEQVRKLAERLAAPVMA